MSSDVDQNFFEQEPDDSEDEMDWEEVDVPAHFDVDIEEPPQQEHIEITLQALPSKTKGKKGEDETKCVEQVIQTSAQLTLEQEEGDIS